MSILRATISLADTTGLDANRFVNVWHFETIDGGDPAAATSISTFLPVFYQNSTLGPLFSPVISRAALVHKVIVASVTPGSPGSDDDTVGRPLTEFSWTMTPAATATAKPLPNEVALCLSFRGSIFGVPEEGIGDSRPASRRRGRVFLGPWHETSVSPLGAAQGRPTDTLRNAILNAYLGPIASLKSVSPPINHVVYSPTEGVAFTVINASVDDAWDTVRSRGIPPLGRISVAVP